MCFGSFSTVPPTLQVNLMSFAARAAGNKQLRASGDMQQFNPAAPRKVGGGQPRPCPGRGAKAPTQGLSTFRPQDGAKVIGQPFFGRLGEPSQIPGLDLPRVPRTGPEVPGHPGQVPGLPQPVPGFPRLSGPLRGFPGAVPGLSEPLRRFPGPVLGHPTNQYLRL